MDRDFSLEDVREALSYLNESSRDVWIQMGMAIKDEFGDAGFSPWDDWGRGYAKYNAAVAKQTWKSFRKGGISLGTLIHEARCAGWQPRQMDDAERARLAAEVAERRKVTDAQAKVEAEHDAKLADAVAELAQRVWACSSTTGMSKYLGVKRVSAHNIGFYNEPVIAEINTDTCEHSLIIGWDGCNAYMNDVATRDKDTDPRSFKFLKRGTLGVPMRDANGQLRNMQFIFKTGAKTFIRGGQKSGTCHVVGKPATWKMGEPLGDVICIAEGYATAASIHEATGLPVVVAWDKGNLLAVGDFLRRLYPSALLMYCADDDRDTDGNPGVTSAKEAAAATNGVFVVPQFLEVA